MIGVYLGNGRKRCKIYLLVLFYLREMGNVLYIGEVLIVGYGKVL